MAVTCKAECQMTEIWIIHTHLCYNYYENIHFEETNLTPSTKFMYQAATEQQTEIE
jgi:hypothetical protein